MSEISIVNLRKPHVKVKDDGGLSRAELEELSTILYVRVKETERELRVRLADETPDRNSVEYWQREHITATKLHAKLHQLAVNSHGLYGPPF